MGKCRICIEMLENAYTVEVPDMAERVKREAAAKKNKDNNGMASPYMGDATKEYAAKTPEEVLALVKTALVTMKPEDEYAMAFEEASGGDAED